MPQIIIRGLPACRKNTYRHLICTLRAEISKIENLGFTPDDFSIVIAFDLINTGMKKSIMVEIQGIPNGLTPSPKARKELKALVGEKIALFVEQYGINHCIEVNIPLLLPQDQLRLTRANISQINYYHRKASNPKP